MAATAAVLTDEGFGRDGGEAGDTSLVDTCGTNVVVDDRAAEPVPPLTSRGFLFSNLLPPR